MFYRQVTTAASLDALPHNAVVSFGQLAAVKKDDGNWIVTGEPMPLHSTILANMATTFNVVSEYTFFPEEGYDTHRVNISKILQFVHMYGEIPWDILFEWIRDFYGVPLDTARKAVEHTIQTNKIVATEEGTLKLP